MNVVDPSPHARRAGFIAMAIAVMMVGGQASSRVALAGGPVPPNDNCSGAIVLPGAGPFPLLTATVDVSNAGFENSDPVPSCIDFLDDFSIWYSFTPAATSTYRISTCASDAPGSTVDDTVLAVYTTPACGANYTEIACDDDSCGTENFQGTLTTVLNAGTRYFIYASTLSTPTGANDDIQILIEKLVTPTAPANDTCAGAEVIPAAGPFPYLTTVTADITNATDAGDPPLPTCRFMMGAVSRSTWYSFTPAATGGYTISSCADGPTGCTVNDTVIGVYTSIGGCPGTFTQIACDDDSCTNEGLQAVTSANLTGGTQYFVVVWQFGTAPPTVGNTAVQLRVSQDLIFADGFE
jgi:hypothetical protein